MRGGWHYNHSIDNDPRIREETSPTPCHTVRLSWAWSLGLGEPFAASFHSRAVVSILRCSAPLPLELLKNPRSWAPPQTFCIRMTGGRAGNLPVTRLLRGSGTARPAGMGGNIWFPEYQPRNPTKRVDSGGDNSNPQKPKSPTGKGTSEGQCPPHPRPSLPLFVVPHTLSF